MSFIMADQWVGLVARMGGGGELWVLVSHNDNNGDNDTTITTQLQMNIYESIT